MTEPDLTSAISDRKMVDRFHKVLAVVQKVCPDKKDRRFAHSLQLPKVIPMQQHRDSWSVYLDHLCWLLDYETGGKTVTSIAVEHYRFGPRYWLACNRNISEKMSEHLISILNHLKKSMTLPVQDGNELEDTMFAESVAFSRPIIKNYVNRLLGRFKDIEEPNDQITKIRKLFEAKATNHYEICQLAYNFCKTESMQHLKVLSVVNEVVKSIRHDIGRLGSWRRAAIALRKFVVDHPEVVRNFKVMHLSAQRSPRCPMDDQSIITTVQDVLPHVSLNNIQAVLGMKTILDCQEVITGLSDEVRLGRAYSSTHCEIIMAEHFYANNLAFWGGRRSIGCSKPSCYCCDIYLKKHPGNFEARPCHGNVYVTWQPPSMTPQSTEVLQPHVRLCLDNLMQTMEKDIITNFIVKSPTRRRTPDSATAITSTNAPSVL